MDCTKMSCCLINLVQDTEELIWTLYRTVPEALTFETGTGKISTFILLEASSFFDRLYFKVLLIPSSYSGRNCAALQTIRSFLKGAMNEVTDPPEFAFGEMDLPSFSSLCHCRRAQREKAQVVIPT